MRGYGFAFLSILLGSFAQLVMKTGVAQIPSQQQIMVLLQEPRAYAGALILIGLGFLAYAVSMACWMGVLSYLPLNRAYPLLSLSYGLVYVAAVCLPWFDEPFVWSRFFGVVLIIAGIVVMNWRRIS